MGVPFSQEVKTAVDLATDLKSHATIVLYAIVVASAIHVVLLSTLLLALVGLIICVNPDLTEERKAFVTPVLRWILFPLRGWNAAFLRTAEAGEREPRRGEIHEGESKGSNESMRGQRRRRTFLGGAE